MFSIPTIRISTQMWNGLVRLLSWNLTFKIELRFQAIDKTTIINISSVVFLKDDRWRSSLASFPFLYLARASERHRDRQTDETTVRDVFARAALARRWRRRRKDVDLLGKETSVKNVIDEGVSKLPVVGWDKWSIEDDTVVELTGKDWRNKSDTKAMREKSTRERERAMNWCRERGREKSWTLHLFNGDTIVSGWYYEKPSMNVTETLPLNL